VNIIEKAAARLADQANGLPQRHRPDTSPHVPPAIRPAALANEPVAIAPAALPRMDQMPPRTPAPAAVPDSPRVSPPAACHTIDLDRLRQAGMVMPNGERTPVAEEFRFIKRPLLDLALRTGEGALRHGNLIMVTSSLPGEGKTFCAINLALSIAMEMDHTVLLVDADVARPSVLDALGLDADRGLMDLLRDDTLALADVMIKTSVDTLSIVPAGISRPNATELLASQSMKRLLEEIATRYHDRIVIFDSPPLLLTSEAHVLVEQMGQVVVVVEAETTTQNAVRESLHRIENCRNVSLIYNKANTFAQPEAYGYYRK
jgi:protein-tyrosine kinase